MFEFKGLIDTNNEKTALNAPKVITNDVKVSYTIRIA
jgi:hypothetical protein